MEGNDDETSEGETEDADKDKIKKIVQANDPPGLQHSTSPRIPAAQTN